MASKKDDLKKQLSYLLPKTELHSDVWDRDGFLNSEFRKAFLSNKRSMCAPPAPAHGLYLTKVIY